MLYVLYLLYIKVTVYVVWMSFHLHLNTYLIWLVLIFNQFKWSSANTRDDNTVISVYSWKEHVCFLKEWVTEQRSFGNIISAGNTQTSRSNYTLHITPTNLSCPPFLLFYSSLLPLFLPVSGIMHVFTSKVIVPDLYDRPLTLRVLVQQHQEENTQGHVWAGPNLALCHSVAVTSN